MTQRILKLALASGMIEPLKLLIEDVLTDSGVCFEIGSPPGACDIFMVMVNWGEERQVIAAARIKAGKTPLLAILPFGHDGLAQRVLLAGAQGWFALDSPLEVLRISLGNLANLGPPCRG